jgi:hypothetical protein
MNREFSDELISAYLDGELTSEEQALVEQQLMDSAEHRKLFAELRALRGSLQSLPSHRLGDDFAERVLKRAERQMLASSEDGSAPPPPNDNRIDNRASQSAIEQALVAADNDRRAASESADAAVRPASHVNQTSGLAAIWVAIAASAAVVVAAVLIFPPNGNRSPVASTPKHRAQEGEAESSLAAKQPDATNDRLGAAALEDLDEAKRARALPDLSEQELLSADKAAEVELQRQEALDPTNRSLGNLKRGAALRPQNALQAENAENAERAAAEGAAAQEAATEGAALAKTLGQAEEERLNADRMERAKESIMGRTQAGRSLAAGLEADRNAASAQTDVLPVLVQLTMTQSAADAGVFEQVLRDHNIVFLDDAVEEGQGAEFADRSFAGDNLRLAPEDKPTAAATLTAPNDEVDATAVGGGTKPAQQKKTQERSLRRQSGEVLVLVCDAEQMQGVFRQLEEMPKQQLALRYVSNESTLRELRSGERFAGDTNRDRDRMENESGGEFRGSAGFGGGVFGGGGGSDSYSLPATGVNRFAGGELQPGGQQAGEPVSSAATELDAKRESSPSAGAPPKSAPSGPPQPANTRPAPTTEDTAGASPATPTSEPEPVTDGVRGSLDGESNTPARRAPVPRGRSERDALESTAEKLKAADKQDEASRKRADESAASEAPPAELPAAELPAADPSPNRQANKPPAAASGYATRVPFPELESAEELELRERILREPAADAPLADLPTPATSGTALAPSAPPKPSDDQRQNRADAKADAEVKREQQEIRRGDLALDEQRFERSGGVSGVNGIKDNGVAFGAAGPAAAYESAANPANVNQNAPAARYSITFVIRIVPDPPVATAAPTVPK